MNTPAPALGRAGLLLLLTGQMLPLVDFSIINVALDDISRSLAATPTQLELMVALYGVAFAVCLAMGSKLGDNFGRRRIFLTGVIVFGLASLLCGQATTIGLLLLARTLQGIGAALIVPQILATLHVTLHGSAHARAISLYGGIGGIAFIIGQMGGGWLVSANIAGLGWRNAFLINVPASLIVLLLARHTVPETRSPLPSRIDWLGTFSLALWLCCLLFPMALGPELHWPWQTWMPLLLLAPLAWLIYRNAARQEQQGGQPLLPPRLLRSGSLRFGLLIALLFFTAWSGFMFCMALTLQSGLGMSPAQSGNSFVVLGIAYFVSALRAPRLIARHSPGRILLMGCTIQIPGLLLLAATLWWRWPRIDIVILMPATALIGYGQALIVNCFYRVGLRDITLEDAGAGSAILSTAQQATLGLGPALAGALYLHLLNHGHHYQQAMTGFVLAELIAMLLLVACTVRNRQQLACVARTQARN